MQAHSMKPVMTAVAKTGGRSANAEKCGVKAVTSNWSLISSDRVWVMPGLMVVLMSVALFLKNKISLFQWPPAWAGSMARLGFGASQMAKAAMAKATATTNIN